MERYTTFIKFYIFLDGDFSTLIENRKILNFLNPFVRNRQVNLPV